jgi:hypothetical protein
MVAELVKKYPSLLWNQKVITVFIRRTTKSYFAPVESVTTVRGMKITPLLHYPHHYNLA